MNLFKTLFFSLFFTSIGLASSISSDDDTRTQSLISDNADGFEIFIEPSASSDQELLPDYYVDADPDINATIPLTLPTHSDGTPDLDTLLEKGPHNSKLMAFIEKHTSCCAGYHVLCQSFWSAIDGPLGVTSLLLSAATTVLSAFAAAALVSDIDLVRVLSITSTCTGVTSAVLGSLKMYAAGRSTTEQLKTIDDIEINNRVFLTKLESGRNSMATFVERDPDNIDYQHKLAAWDSAIDAYGKSFKKFQTDMQTVKVSHDNIIDSQSKQQNFVLNTINNNATLAGNITTDIIDPSELPPSYQRCIECLGCYDIFTFTLYNVLQGPAGLMNMLFTTASAALMAFSIFNTGSTLEALVYTAAACSAAATFTAAVKFYSMARVKSALTRIMHNRSEWTKNFYKQEHEKKLQAHALKDQKREEKRQSQSITNSHESSTI